MQKIILVLGIMFLLSCKKNSEPDNGISINYSGNYKGNINIAVNGTATPGLTDYTITVDEAGNGFAILSNNVFNASTGTIAQTTLTLNKNFIAVSPTSNKVQYGTAVFTATSMTINFHEDEVETATNNVLNTKVWTGVLVKQ
jgi:hypothetical protein